MKLGKKNKTKSGTCVFSIDNICEAKIINIRESSISFLVSDRYRATYYVHGGNLNLFKIFKIGQTINVKVIDIKHKRDVVDKFSYCYKEFIVVPDVLPIDVFIKMNGVGSTVTAVVVKTKNDKMLVSLASDVFAFLKRCKKANKGKVIECVVTGYNPVMKRVSLVKL